MKQMITEIAYSIGIKIIGFTSVLDYGYLARMLADRAGNRYDCEFEEQDINKRLDVRNVFPECKSIIAVGVPYAEGYRKPVTENKGLLSVVSSGEDYHEKIKGILKELAGKIKEHTDFKYEICVDTSPLIDREICKNAGIGSYGKNTLLINEKFGPFINLGYLLTDLETECGSNTDNINICGDCRICMESCPNNAILKDGSINARKCVSYLTQTKNYIPFEYRKNMGNQIYGCDVCQLVCPKNKLNSEKKPGTDYGGLLIDLSELMLMSNKEFASKYGRLSGSWRGRNIWKRNALIAAGNLGLGSMFETVKNELSNPSEMIKIYAAWCLTELNRQKAVEILHAAMKYENDRVKKEYMKLAEAEYDSGNM